MNRPRYYPSVDGLKGLLIFLIVLHNLLPSVPGVGDVRIIDRIPLTSFISVYGGSLGDCLFFVFSGFLISTGYRNTIREHRIAFAPYLLKRLRKLYPMYILSNLAMLILAVLEYGPSGINLKRIVFTAVMQLGGGLTVHPYNGPSWFLSALFLCYVLYYGISYFARHSTQYSISILLGIICGYAMYLYGGDFPLLCSSNGIGVMNFFIGCVIAEVYPWVRENRPSWLPTACFVILGGSFYLMLRYGIEIIAGNSLIAFAFLVSPLLLYLALDSKWFSRLLETSPIQFLGKISICVFFWHFPLFTAMRLIFQWLGTTFTEVYFPLFLLLLVLLGSLHHRRSKKKATK